jgi:hypothetical protein
LIPIAQTMSRLAGEMTMLKTFVSVEPAMDDFNHVTPPSLE